MPDETKRVELYRYVNPRPATWPDADFIIGNPPFIGVKRLRDRLGDGYVEALWAAYPKMPRSAEFVMYWWQRAAHLVRDGKVRRFGLITTNSLPQTFNRRVVAAHLEAKNPLSLTFAIPDHPWYLGGDMAAVRIAMTVGVAGKRDGQLVRVFDSQRQATRGGDELRPPRSGLILSNLTDGIDLDEAKPLQAGGEICGLGVALHGSGFILTSSEATRLAKSGEAVIKPYVNGRDLLHRPKPKFLIDFSFLSESEARSTNPAAFQHVVLHVKPERDENQRDQIRRLWWRFGWERPVLRGALKSLRRFIATTETAKHRTFQFLWNDVLPDHMVICIALDDAFFLGVLSSRVHVTWALAAGGTLENRPRYNKTRCFDPFPFPAATAPQQQAIRDLAEQLDAHRKRVLAEHEDLTLTGLYNVLEKLRAGEALTEKEQDIHERGLVSVMKHLHEQIDAAVFDAYSWPRDLSGEAILARLVELNKERRTEEARGLVRWLRPEYQAPAAKKIMVGEQGQLDITHVPSTAKARARKASWPKTLPERITTIRGLLAVQPRPAHLEELARRFQRAPRDDVQEVLNALVALGLARRLDGNRYAP